MRTLSPAPSSFAGERSISVQKRIRTDARNRILANKIRKLIFCYWNGKLCNRDDDSEDNFELRVCVILTAQEL